MGGQDGTIMDEGFLMDTVSGNGLPGDEAPAEDGNGAGGSVTQPEEPGQAADGSEQEPGAGAENQDKADKENPPGQDAGVQGQPIVIVEDGDPAGWREDVSNQLAELARPEDNTDVTGRLDALIQLLTPEEVPEEAAEDTGDVDPAPYVASLFNGYAEWGYPVTVQSAVYPYGSGDWLEQEETYQDAGSFLTGYEETAAQCGEGGTLRDFYVKYIWDCSGGKVYDYELLNAEPEPEPAEGEGDGTAGLLLSHLEGINTTLSGMVQADMDFYQMVEDYNTEMLKMQAASTATDIFICIGVFAVFITLVWSQLFGRFK